MHCGAPLARRCAEPKGQEAKFLAVHAAKSLARLWQSQGKKDDEGALLTPGHGWFTEAFDTKDPKGARALLRELGR